MAKKNALEEAKNLYNRIRGGISAGSQNFKGNVQAIANPATRADFFRGFNPTNPVQPIQIGSMTLGPTYGQQQLVQGTMRGLYDYGKGQVVQPILNAPRQIIQGIQQTAQPGLGASGLPNRVVGPIKVGLGALGAVGGAFSATPIGATFNTIQGGLAGGIRSFRTGQPLGRSVYQGITEPTGIMSQGFGVKNPIVAGLGDLAFGLGVGGVTAKLTGHLPKQPVKEQISSVARKRYVSKLKGLYPEEMPQRNIEFVQVGNKLIRKHGQEGFIKPSEFLPKKGGQKVTGVQEPGKMRAEYPDSTNNPLYQAMRRAQDALTAKIEPLRSKYKTEAEIPAPLKKELTILQTDWQTKAKTWKDVYVNKMDVGAGLTQEQARAKFQASRGLASKTPPLTTEARKYKSAEEFVKAQFAKKPEYGMSHRPSYEGMPPAYNLLEGETLPRDVYTHPDFSIATGRIRSGDKAANESWQVLQKIKDNPEAEVTLYRAGAKNELNSGDWVTFSKDYAKQSLEGSEKVHSFKAKAKDVIFAGDDINEFGYYPKSQLTDIYNQAKGGGVGRVTTQIPKDQSLGLQEIGSNLPPTVSPKAGKVRITDKPLDLSKSRPSKPIIPENPIRAEITGVKKPGLITKIREVVQDNWIRVKELQRQEGVKVTESANPYLKEELYHGRVGARIERVKEQITNVDKDILTTSKKINLPDSKLKDDINKYLIAKHAPERNARLGDGSAGMTNKEAQDILSGITSSGHGKEVQRIATELKKMSDETLDVLLRERVIGKDLYNQLKTAYKNHIPLQRVMGGEDIVDVLVNKGFSVQGTGLKRARGSERQVADLMTNITSNLEQAIVRSEKNRVNLATLEFARNNKQLGIFEEIKPRAIGKTFDDKPILQEVKDPLVLKVMEDGKPTYLKIKDQKLATVFQGIGNERLPSVFKFVEAFTRFYSGLHTRFNPEFAASNIIRDTQEMAVFMASQPNIGFKGVGKTVLKDPASAKTIIDSMMGKSTPETKLYEQLKLDGGTTGGMALSTRQQVELDIADIVKTNRSNPRLATQKLLKSFDNWNTVFEDATRLSVYKQGLESGMSREAAASLAKNSTVNFNKKGTGGPIINSLYMFSNASIQGSAKMLRAMKNPKVAAIVTTAVGTSVFAVNNWNDQVDPDWRDKVTEWDRNSNMVVMLPSSEGAKYITIPISWGLKPIKVAADTAFDLSSGHQKNIGDAAVNIAESAFDAYNPAGGENLISAITPTFLDTPSELARNESWSGGIIKPDWMSGLRGSEQMFKDTDKTLSGRVAIGTTKALSTAGIEVSPNDLLYAYKAYIGGVGKLATRVINTSGALIKGEKPEAKDVPFSNRFYKVRSEEETSRSVTKSKEVDFMRGVKRFETGGVEQKDFIRDYVIQLPTDEDRQSFLYKIGQSGIPTKGISSTIKNLAIQFYLSGDKEQAKELGTKYTFNVTQKEVESEKKRLVGEVADLFVEGKEDEAKKMSDTYSLTVRTIDAQKAAKKLAKKKYKSGDIEGAKALTVKYKFILTNKDVE